MNGTGGEFRGQHTQLRRNDNEFSMVSFESSAYDFGNR